MGHAFGWCENLESIKFSTNFKTNNVNYIDGLFEDCKKLKSLDLSSFDTSNAINMQNMFKGCSSL